MVAEPGRQDAWRALVARCEEPLPEGPEQRGGPAGCVGESGLDQHEVVQHDAAVQVGRPPVCEHHVDLDAGHVAVRARRREHGEAGDEWDAADEVEGLAEERGQHREWAVLDRRHVRRGHRRLRGRCLGHRHRHGLRRACCGLPAGPARLNPARRHGGSGAARRQDPGVRHHRTCRSFGRGRGTARNTFCSHPSGGRRVAPVQEGIGGPRGDDGHDRYDRKSCEEDVPRGLPDLRSRTTRHRPHLPP